MRLPGTLKSLLEQVKRSPVPIGSISITPEGAVSLTFGDEKPIAAPVAPAQPAKMSPTAPLRQRDTVGAFKTPPIARESPWTPPPDGAA